MEGKVIKRFFHEHALILRENVDNDESVDCYGCGNRVSNYEWAYICEHCSSMVIFHKRCGELATLISHSKHSHPLHLVDFQQLRWHRCDLCRRHFGEELGYRCSTCDFDLDIKCKELERDELLGDPRELQHPCHDIHPLMLMRKLPFVFHCDACGAEAQDTAYACTDCDLLIHKACASLPTLLPVDRHRHHHHLSLSSCFPFRHRNFEYQCDVCGKDIDLSCWVYYCDDCRYFAHLTCATSTEQDSSNLINEKDGYGSDLIQFPLEVRDISQKLITPFVIQENGLDKIPDVNDMPPSINIPKTTASYSFLFNYHMHTLSFVSELSHKDKIIEADDDDDEDEVMKMKICDVCIAPISSPPYYECAPCKYYVHSVCYLLPKTLSSLEPEKHGECKQTDENHKFKLYTSSERLDKGHSHLQCELCGSYTNGMVYECEECKMKIDVKCASLPTTIKHASHHPHHTLSMKRLSEAARGKWIECYCCEHNCTAIAYCCSKDDCSFSLCLECVLLPRSIIKKEWDEHPLLLTYDAFIDHPSDFYCNICEQEMHPKKWMYHCRQCDNSFHIYCLRTAFEWYRNIKFGRQFELDARLHPQPLTFNRMTDLDYFMCRVCETYERLHEGFKYGNYAVCRRCGYFELEKKYRNIKFGRRFEFDRRFHPHPLTFNQITIKLRCDICHHDECLYEGFECASCYFVVCWKCGRAELDKE